ncbi:2-amino-4-hydroxy-6-hydroxymethyldihydropteridine diphosphokinase [Planctomicrobium sp. SH661]|uniref:2-amino-4-hydroxy-6- hydroxymethyldihydropteridine diphosphokinase n=1 Tax=Planctomicrobium sp. SH661 TaxID=3448124 RepID=UPI003F5C115D
MTNIAAIAMGGNLGDVCETFHRAVTAMGSLSGVEVVAVSSNYVTRAIGTNSGSDYINAAALLSVDCSPIELLRKLQQIEADLGRVRTLHWGPRTLDLDIISYGDEVINHTEGERSADSSQLPTGPAENDSLSISPSTLNPQPSTLFVPHPACWYRRFVLDPWCEIAPDWKHPVLLETVREMQSRLLKRPIDVGVNLVQPLIALVTEMIKHEFTHSDVRIIPEDGERQSPDVPLDVELCDSSTLSQCASVNPRAITLSHANAVETAKQILRAALDEPQLLESR